MNRIYHTPTDLDSGEIRALYDGFDEPVTDLDCGRMCAGNNPSGKPFCCDLQHAVPAAYLSEWAYAQAHTDLWQPWSEATRAEGAYAQSEIGKLLDQTPASMTLLACLGPRHCRREFRLLSCRQFPFFPYVSSDYRFLGLAPEWEFAERCWVLQNLGRVTETYREKFVATFDRLFALFDEEFEAYARKSAELRDHFAGLRCRFPLLNRNGKNYRVSPISGKLEKWAF